MTVATVGGNTSAGQKGGSVVLVAAMVTGLLSVGVRESSSLCDQTDFEAFVARVRVTNYHVWRKVSSRRIDVQTLLRRLATNHQLLHWNMAAKATHASIQKRQEADMDKGRHTVIERKND